MGMAENQRHAQHEPQHDGKSAEPVLPEPLRLPLEAVGIAALSGLPTILGALLGYSAGVMDPALLALLNGYG